MTFLDDSGKVWAGSGTLGTLVPGEVHKIDTRSVIRERGIKVSGNALGVAHLVPTRFRGGPASRSSR